MFDNLSYCVMTSEDAIIPWLQRQQWELPCQWWLASAATWDASTLHQKQCPYFQIPGRNHCLMDWEVRKLEVLNLLWLIAGTKRGPGAPICSWFWKAADGPQAGLPWLNKGMRIKRHQRRSGRTAFQNGCKLGCSLQSPHGGHQGEGGQHAVWEVDRQAADPASATEATPEGGLIRIIMYHQSRFIFCVCVMSIDYFLCYLHSRAYINNVNNVI
jgi:hypothetical protein